MADFEPAFARIDKLLERIQRYAVEPAYSNDVARRTSMPDFDLNDNEVLRIMVELIAFSQQAPAKRIVEMIDRGVFSRIFASFEPAAVARMEPESLLKHYWNQGLSPIRFRSKVSKMVDCARSLETIAVGHGSFMSYLRTCQFPNGVQTSADVDRFWISFDNARLDAPSFYQNFISLCHLLTTLGFPCAKPDRVVMSVASELGIVAPRKQHSEFDQKRVVQLMQSYATRKGITVPVVDLVFLIRGNQTDARKYVDPAYYAEST